jgi:hypothetical protein
LYIVQNGASKKITLSSLAASILSGNVSNTASAILLLGNADVNGPNSAVLSIDRVNDSTGFYMDKTVVQMYTSSYVQIVTDTDGVGYVWNFNKDGTTTLPINAYVPATSTSTGTIGQVAWNSNYIYVCVNTNTWKRTALTTW